MNSNTSTTKGKDQSVKQNSGSKIPKSKTWFQGNCTICEEDKEVRWWEGVDGSLNQYCKDCLMEYAEP